METTYTAGQQQQAYELGRQHALNAASWVIDGNTDPEHIARMVRWMDDGDSRAYDYLPTAPNLSGEYSDDPTPRSLYEDIMGVDHSEEEAKAGLAYETLVGSVMDGLADAYEAGVSENFEAECERILRAAL
jgi:hypothetical protein